MHSVLSLLPCIYIGASTIEMEYTPGWIVWAMQQAQHYEGQGLAQVAIREQASGTDTVTLEAPTTEETWDQFM